MSCQITCACQCQNSTCGCLEPGKQPPPRPKKADPDTYRNQQTRSTTP